jgi:hydrogenase nickel incorporation protein HypB
LDQFKVLTIKKNVWEGNDQRAAGLRAELERDQVFMLNLMSSPGSGKTTTLLRTIAALKDELRLGVMEADLDADVDARTIAATGTKVVQLHTGGMCHLDADMTRQGLDALGTAGLDLVFLENVGNLICTAEFDTGAARNAMILSVPEGHDKPLKYPHMFSMVDALIINKIDALPMFDFDIQAVSQSVRRLNPDVAVFPISAKTGEGVEAWAGWLRAQVAGWREKKTPARAATRA